MKAVLGAYPVEGGVGSATISVSSRGSVASCLMYADTCGCTHSDASYQLLIRPVWKSMAWHANNYPLRGGKHTNWEGGVRVVAFASGGFLPASRHGLVLHGIMHNADW